MFDVALILCYNVYKVISCFFLKKDEASIRGYIHWYIRYGKIWLIYGQQEHNASAISGRSLIAVLCLFSVRVDVRKNQLKRSKKAVGDL
jgi:hypothetical protein